LAPRIAFLLNCSSSKRDIMNEEGGIYRESFHLTWAKSMAFPGAKKSQKVTFFASHRVPGTFGMRLGSYALGS
jgi:hypothetical protein